MSKKLSKRDEIDANIGCLLVIVMVVSGICFICSGFLASFLADFEWRLTHLKVMFGSCFFFFLAFVIFICIGSDMTDCHIRNGTYRDEEDEKED